MPFFIRNTEQNGARVVLDNPMFIGANVGDFIEIDAVAYSGNNIDVYRILDYNNNTSAVELRDGAISVRVEGATFTVSTNYAKPNINQRFLFRLEKTNVSEYTVFLDSQNIGSFTTTNNYLVDKFFGIFPVNTANTFLGAYYKITASTNGGEVTNRWNPSATNGTGNILVDEIGGNNGTLNEQFVLPNSWVAYEDAYFLRFNGVDNWATLPTYTLPTSGIYEIEVTVKKITEGGIFYHHNFPRLLTEFSTNGSIISELRTANLRAQYDLPISSFNDQETKTLTLRLNLDNGLYEQFIDGRLIRSDTYSDFVEFQGTNHNYLVGQVFDSRFSEMELYNIKFKENDVIQRNYKSNGADFIDTVGNQTATLVNFLPDNSQHVAYKQDSYLTFNGIDEWVRLPEHIMPANGIYEVELDLKVFNNVGRRGILYSNALPRFSLELQDTNKIAVTFQSDGVIQTTSSGNNSIFSGERKLVTIRQDFNTGLFEFLINNEVVGSLVYPDYELYRGSPQNYQLGQTFQLFFAEINVYHLKIKHNGIVQRHYNPELSDNSGLVLFDSVGYEHADLQNYTDNDLQWKSFDAVENPEISVEGDYYLENNVQNGAYLVLDNEIIIGNNIGDYLEIDAVGYAGNAGDHYRIAANNSFETLLRLEDNQVLVRVNNAARFVSQNYTKPSINQRFVFRLERTASEEYTAFLDGVDIGKANTPTFFDLTRFFGQSNQGFVGAYYSIEASTSGGTVTNRWLPSLSNGNGLILYDEIGGNTGRLTGSWPTDGSQWVYYETGVEPVESVEQLLVVLTSEQSNESSLLSVSQMQFLNCMTAQQTNQSSLLTTSQVNLLKSVVSQQVNQSSSVNLDNAIAISLVVSEQDNNTNSLSVEQLQSVTLVISKQDNEAQVFGISQVNLIDLVSANQINETTIVDILQSSSFDLVSSEQVNEADIVSILPSGGDRSLKGLTIHQVTEIYTLKEI